MIRQIYQPLFLSSQRISETYRNFKERMKLEERIEVRHFKSSKIPSLHWQKKKKDHELFEFKQFEVK